MRLLALALTLLTTLSASIAHAEPLAPTTTDTFDATMAASMAFTEATIAHNQAEHPSRDALLARITALEAATQDPAIGPQERAAIRAALEAWRTHTTTATDTPSLKGYWEALSDVLVAWKAVDPTFIDRRPRP